MGGLLIALANTSSNFTSFRCVSLPHAPVQHPPVLPLPCPVFTVKPFVFFVLFAVKLQLQAEERGVVSIKGVSANRFLAMKEDGRLLALKYATEECFFFERLESNNYNTYRSRKYSDWYVALKRTGQYKPGPKTGPGQKAILFLPMSAKS
uniref:Fibroblast growth factor n=1 Tax=Zonotrichia albicollis TaxID=44394 RepID=A0A8D2NK67_ZONAL